jgi:hypothetical protein
MRGRAVLLGLLAWHLDGVLASPLAATEAVTTPQASGQGGGSSSGKSVSFEIVFEKRLWHEKLTILL